MVEYEVTCVNKNDRYDPAERITHIGNRAANWKITQQRAIELIEKNEARFYTVRSNVKAYLVVQVSRFNNKYLKTENDTTESNNLLELPECL
jgi:hypothetical protein